jgi:hypothetical protein
MEDKKPRTVKAKIVAVVEMTATVTLDRDGNIEDVQDINEVREVIEPCELKDIYSVIN